MVAASDGRIKVSRGATVSVSESNDDQEMPPAADVDDTPTIRCTRCDRTWDLEYELDELNVGNQSFEQFALDHMRHTGHFPDGVSPWTASCRHCPGSERFLAAGPARRWAETHARHTRHTVALDHDDEETTVVAPE